MNTHLHIAVTQAHSADLNRAATNARQLAARTRTEGSIMQSRGSLHNAVSLALVVALALVVSAACAASAGAAGAEPRVAGWAEASEGAGPAGLPTLINDVGQPSGGAESQLPVGLGLLAVGLLGVGYGLWLLSATHRRRGPGETRHVARARMARTSDAATTPGA